MSNPLLQQWQSLLAAQASDPAIFDASGSPLRTFQEIEEEARGWIDRLQHLPKGSVVLARTTHSPRLPGLFLACLHGNWALMPMETSRRDIHAILQRYQVAIDLDLAQDELTEYATGSPFSDSNPAVCLLKLTSGSTGRPRAIRFTEAQLMADGRNICQTMGIGPRDRNLAAISMAHSYGFSNLITPLLFQGTPMVICPDPLPHSLAETIQKAKPTVFPGVPAFFRALTEIPSRVDLSSLRLCISAGAPLHAELVHAFHARFERKLHSFYGASECGGICYDASEELPTQDGVVGRPMRGVRILEVPVSEGAGTRIEVRSDAVGLGFYPAEESDSLADGRFQPGDRLDFCPQGYRVVGRMDDLLNVAGRKVDPAPVEVFLRNQRGVIEAKLFGIPTPGRGEMLVACVVPGPDWDESKVLKACRSHLNSWQIPRHFWCQPHLPVDQRGKSSKSLLQTLYKKSNK